MELKLHYVSFGDLETSLVEMCNCMQHAEEHFVTWAVFDPFPKQMNLTIAYVLKDYLEKKIKIWQMMCILRLYVNYLLLSS